MLAAGCASGPPASPTPGHRVPLQARIGVLEATLAETQALEREVLSGRTELRRCGRATPEWGIEARLRETVERRAQAALLGLDRLIVGSVQRRRSVARICEGLAPGADPRIPLQMVRYRVADAAPVTLSALRNELFQVLLASRAGTSAGCRATAVGGGSPPGECSGRLAARLLALQADLEHVLAGLREDLGVCLRLARDHPSRSAPARPSLLIRVPWFNNMIRGPRPPSELSCRLHELQPLR